MLQIQRASCMDVSNTVDVTDPAAVSAEVQAILRKRFPQYDFSSVDVLVSDFSRL